MRILVNEKLSPHKMKTPEGYLICTDAILSRTGKQTYRRSELWGDACDNADEEVEVDRKAEEVFNDKTLASFENKPICIEHPDEDVNVNNHNQLSVGFVRDIKRGKVDGQDVMLGTLVITDADAVEAIERGDYTELSCGYNCDIVDEDNPQQRNIRGNHVALCEHGRAGIARIVDSDNLRDADYEQFSKQGYLVRALYKDGGRIHAILERKSGDFVVAYGYNSNTGEWAQGRYVSSWANAVQTMNEEKPSATPIRDSLKDDDWSEVEEENYKKANEASMNDEDSWQIKNVGTAYVLYYGSKEVKRFPTKRLAIEWVASRFPNDKIKTEDSLKMFKISYVKDDVTYINKVRANSIEDAISKVKDNAHKVVVFTNEALRELGKNNSIGKYDRVVQAMRSLYSETLLPDDELKEKIRQTLPRLIAKYVKE